MKFTVRQAADAHQKWIDGSSTGVIPALGPVTDYIGRNVGLRIGDLAYGVKLDAVEQVGDEVLLTFDMVDSDLRWEMLIEPAA